MSTETNTARRRAWAKPVERLHVGDVPRGAGNLRRRAAGRRRPAPGLRQDVAEDLPRAAAGATWHRRRGDPGVEAALPVFWPKGNRFYAPLTGIEPGEVALIDLARAGRHEALDRRDGDVRRRRVVHADDAAGPHVRRLDHVQRVRGDGVTVAQAQVLMRAQRSALRARAAFGGHGQEDRLLAAHARSRWPRTSVSRATCRHAGGLRRPQAPVVECGQRVAQSASAPASTWRCAHAARSQAVLAWLSAGARRDRRRRRAERPCRGDRAGPGRPLGTGARGGRDVGGGTRTAELTLPGFRHDVCSAIHPLDARLPVPVGAAAGGARPALASSPRLPLAHPLDDGTAVVLAPLARATTAAPGRRRSGLPPADRPAGARLAAHSIDDLLGPPAPAPPPARDSPASGSRRSARRPGCRAARFAGEPRARAVRGHRGALDAAAGAPRDGGVRARCCDARPRASAGRSRAGGSQAITDAMASLLRSLGGEIETGTPVTSLADLPRARGRAAGRHAARSSASSRATRCPARYRRRAAPLPLRARRLQARLRARRRRCRGRPQECAAGRHRARRRDARARSPRPRPRWRAAAIPERPYVLVAQQSLFDPSARARRQAHAVGLLPRAQRIDAWT